EESPAWKKLDRRDRELRDKYKEKLLEPFRGLAMSGHVIRGFVERLSMHARRFMNEGGRLFSLTLLHTVRFIARRDHHPNEATFPELVARPPVRLLRGLALEGSRPSRDDCAALALPAHTRQVRSLGLSWAELDDEGLAALFPTRAWPRLTRLELERNSFGPE